MIARKLLTITTAAAMALAPTLAYGASPTSVAPARAGAPMGDSNGLLESSRSTQLTLGFLALLAILLVVFLRDDDGPNNPVAPVSP